MSEKVNTLHRLSSVMIEIVAQHQGVHSLAFSLHASCVKLLSRQMNICVHRGLNCRWIVS